MVMGLVLDEQQSLSNEQGKQQTRERYNLWSGMLMEVEGMIRADVATIVTTAQCTWPISLEHACSVGGKI
jgi:hypothetical protein